MHPEIDQLLDTACFLDPRSKAEHICSENLDSIKTRIRNDGVRSLEHAPDSESTAVPQEQGETEARLQPPPKKRKLANILKRKKDNTSATLSPRSQEDKEIENYLSAPDLDVESNPLLWRKCEATCYPILCKLAKKYLSVCAISAASERVFSSSGKIVTPVWTSLKPDKVNKLVFSKKS